MIMRTALALAILASPAAAELTVSFVDSAPKDIFEISYVGTCPLPAETLRIDIGTAPAGLIFDTTASGAGVQVFQPFELVAGATLLTEMPVILDGDTIITLPLTGLNSGDVIRFTIDVDDTTSSRQITVSGSKMAGASAALGPSAAAFGADGIARIETPGCFG
ncbi:MAG: aggregation factor core [Pseudomonadota bacterium]